MMDEKNKYFSFFSDQLKGLELQIRTLLEGVGGANAARLLDAVSRLNPLEQEVVLQGFTRVVERIASGKVRYSRLEDEELKEVEDKLYQDLIRELDQAVSTKSRGSSLVVLNGGNGGNGKSKAKAPRRLRRIGKVKTGAKSPKLARLRKRSIH